MTRSAVPREAPVQSGSAAQMDTAGEAVPNRKSLTDSGLAKFPFRLLPHFEHPATALESTLKWEEKFAASASLPTISIDYLNRNHLTLESLAVQSVLPVPNSDYRLVITEGVVLHPSTIFILGKKLLERNARGLETDFIYWDEIAYDERNYSLNSYSRKARPSFITFLGRPLVGGAFLVSNRLWSLISDKSDSTELLGWFASLEIVEQTALHIPLALSNKPSSHVSRHISPPKEKLSAYLKMIGVEIESLRETTQNVEIILRGEVPELAVVIPFRNQASITILSLKSLATQTVAKNLNVYLVNNGSDLSELNTISATFAELPFRSVTVLNDTDYFNFARLNNVAIREIQKRGALDVVLLNNDVELSTRNHLEQLYLWSRLPEVGLVGGTLSYPGGRIQSAGINFSQVRPANVNSSAMYAEYLREVDGLTFALVLIRKELLAETLLDEFSCPNGFGDAIFSAKARELGYRCLLAPWLKAIHHESASRGFRPEELELLEMVEHGVPISDLWSDLSAERQPMEIPLTHSQSAFQSVVRKISRTPKLLAIAEAICSPAVKAGKTLRRLMP